MSKMKSKYPNVFLAGAPKCGTSSLAHYLGQHPDIFSPHLKEPIYFGSDLIARNRISSAEYLGHYGAWCEECYALDASTHYFFSLNAAHEIHEASSDARIVLMVRNPIEAAHSMYHQLRFNGTEPLNSFEASLDAEADRATQQAPLPRGFIQSFLYSQIYSYSSNIPRYEAAFGRAHVYVCVMDDLDADAAAETAKVCEFLGVDTRGVDGFDFNIQNAAQRSKSRWVNTLAAYPPQWLNYFAAPFPRQFRLKVRDAMRKANSQTITKPKMAPATRTRLQGVFAGDVRWLSKYLGRDLSHWLDD